jgi:hypothetical protein
VRSDLTILAGGQTGADRAALDAALDAGVPCGGWCPAGRLAEDGIIPDHYPLTPLARGGYDERTRQNVIDSDGTVIFFIRALAGGSETTRRCAVDTHRPVLLIDLARETPEEAARQLAAFVQRHAIRRLNVAGPRASEKPAIGPLVYRSVRALLEAE